MITSVYLDQKLLEFNNDGNQDPIYLGKSKIGADKIFAYDFSFGEAFAQRGSDTIYLKKKEYYYYHYGEIDIQLKLNETKKVIFEIDVDRSIIPNAEGDLKFLAKVNIIVE